MAYRSPPPMPTTLPRRRRRALREIKVVRRFFFTPIAQGRRIVAPEQHRFPAFEREFVLAGATFCPPSPRLHHLEPPSPTGAIFSRAAAHLFDRTSGAHDGGAQRISGYRRERCPPRRRFTGHAGQGHALPGLTRRGSQRAGGLHAHAHAKPISKRTLDAQRGPEGHRRVEPMARGVSRGVRCDCDGDTDGLRLRAGAWLGRRNGEAG